MNNKRYLNLLAVLVLSIFTITACSNSVSPEDHGEEAEGFRLKLNGQTIVEQLPDEHLTGSISLEVGEETALISLYFISHDGDEFQPEGEEYSLQATFDSDGIVEFEQHDEDGKWRFHLHGEAEGTTFLRLQLYHGSHSDYDATGVPVTVTPAAN